MASLIGVCTRCLLLTRLFLFRFRSKPTAPAGFHAFRARRLLSLLCARMKENLSMRLSYMKVDSRRIAKNLSNSSCRVSHFSSLPRYCVPIPYENARTTDPGQNQGMLSHVGVSSYRICHDDTDQ